MAIKGVEPIIKPPHQAPDVHPTRTVDPKFYKFSLLQKPLNRQYREEPDDATFEQAGFGFRVVAD